MAEQFIIELTGDATGLAPAVEALKNLSKVSTEATSTVTRTTQEWNTQLSRTTTGLQQQGQQVSNLSSSYKNLTATMSVAAIKQYTESLHKNTEEVKENAGQYKQRKEVVQQTLIDTQALIKAQNDFELVEAKATHQKLRSLEQEALDESKQAAIQAAQEVSDAVFENQAQERQNELDTRLQHLSALKDAELSNTSLTQAQRKAIEEKYRREEAAAKKAAWLADRDAKGEQAIINGLLAFTSALASSPPPMNYINAAIALALAGVQAGIIWSKTPPKFAKGVIGLQGPGTDTSDSIPALLSRGESVITASATRRYEPILRQMNAGTYEPLPIPMLSTLPRLRDLSSVTATAKHEPVIDYDKLGKALATHVKLPAQYHQTLDANGFTTHILNKGNKVQLYNNRMEL